MLRSLWAIDCDLNPCATLCGIDVARRVGAIFAKVRSTLAKSGLCTGGRTWALFPTHGLAGLSEVYLKEAAPAAPRTGGPAGFVGWSASRPRGPRPARVENAAGR